LNTNEPTGTARFAAILATLTAAHEVGDYLVQLDTDARAKGHPDRDGATACARHVLTYTGTQALALYAVNRRFGLGLTRPRAVAALTLSAVTHYAADRCAGRWTETGPTAPLLVRAAHAIGKGPWLTADPNAGHLLDQAFHKGCIALAAAVAVPATTERN
jgi:hypothetical protein